MLPRKWKSFHPTVTEPQGCLLPLGTLKEGVMTQECRQLCCVGTPHYQGKHRSFPPRLDPERTLGTQCWRQRNLTLDLRQEHQAGEQHPGQSGRPREGSIVSSRCGGS